MGVPRCLVRSLADYTSASMEAHLLRPPDDRGICDWSRLLQRCRHTSVLLAEDAPAAAALSRREPSRDHAKCKSEKKNKKGVNPPCEGGGGECPTSPTGRVAVASHPCPPGDPVGVPCTWRPAFPPSLWPPSPSPSRVMSYLLLEGGRLS